MSDRLFDHAAGRATEGDNSPVEHAHLPEAAEREEQPPTVVFSFDSEEERDELVRLLAVRPTRRAVTWLADYPADPEGDLRLDLAC